MVVAADAAAVVVVVVVLLFVQDQVRPGKKDDVCVCV